VSRRVFAVLLLMALLGGCGKYGHPIRPLGPAGAVAPGAAAPAHAEECDDPDHDHSDDREPSGDGSAEATP